MAVHYLAFSADSLRLLSCGADQTVRLWDVRTQAELQCFKGHITPINCAALAPDGQTAVSAGWVMNSTAEDRSAQLWDVKTGKVSKRFKHPSRVDHVAFSDDGSRLFTWCATGSTAREWDVGSGNLVKEIKAPGDPDAAGFSTNGRRVLASYPDVVWRLWDLEGGEKPRRFRFEALPHSIGGKLALCADGNRAVANEHGGAFVWLLDLKTGKEVRPARGHVGRVLGLAFSPDGGQLLTWGQDTTVRLWDAKTRQELHLLGKHEGGVNSAAFSADGSRIVSGGEDGTIRVWAAKSGKELGPRDRPRKKILSVALSRDGRRVLFAENTHNMTDYAVRLWDVDKNKVTTIHAQFPGRVNQVLLSPDGHEAWACDASTLWRWEVDGGKRLPGYEVVKGFTLRHMAYSGDGRQLFFSVIWWGDQNCSVWRWNLAEGKSSPQKLPDWHQANGFVVQFAATWNGEVLATTSRIGALVLSEADSKDVLGEWPTTAFPGGAGPLAFAPDGKRLAVANNHSAVYILDLAPLLARRRR
jgi:WD40 repeat protein